MVKKFLRILPMEIEAWARKHCPENRERVVSLIEDSQRKLEVLGQQVRKEFWIWVIRPKEVAEAGGTGSDICLCVILEP